MQSPNEIIRAKAVGALCPCRNGWESFETHLEWAHRLTKDPSPLVRAAALHVFEDAAQMQSDGLPANPREQRSEMLRTKRASRFRPEPEEDALTPAAKRGVPCRALHR